MSFRTSFGREHFGSQCLYLVYMAGYKFSDFDRSFNSEMKTKERKSSLTSVNKKREKKKQSSKCVHRESNSGRPML